MFRNKNNLEHSKNPKSIANLVAETGVTERIQLANSCKNLKHSKSSVAQLESFSPSASSAVPSHKKYLEKVKNRFSKSNPSFHATLNSNSNNENNNAANNNTSTAINLEAEMSLNKNTENNKANSNLLNSNLETYEVNYNNNNNNTNTTNNTSNKMNGNFLELFRNIFVNNKKNDNLNN